MVAAILMILKMMPECPVDGALTSPYGHRLDPITGRRRWHAGVDLSARRGTPIRSIWAGPVTRLSRSRRGYGNQVLIRTGEFTARYAHAQELWVDGWDVVEPGEQIGTVGSTGRATGPHLHFEVLRGKRRINPTIFVLRCRSVY